MSNSYFVVTLITIVIMTDVLGVGVCALRAAARRAPHPRPCRLSRPHHPRRLHHEVRTIYTWSRTIYIYIIG